LMGRKPYSCDITCCTSSVPRGIALIPYFTFGNVNNIPTLLLYGPAVYKDNITSADKKKISLSVNIESNFPEEGNATITLNSSQSALYSFALRVPSWCNSFIAEAGGRKYKGTANQYVIMKRVWQPGDTIKVSFKIPIQILIGGKSYPGLIAFKRGPQILAFDSSLNIDIIKKYQFGLNQKLNVEKPKSISNPDLLPANWIGNQAYPVTLTYSKPNCEKEQLTLVPFADASQTGGAVKVWMPLKVSGKSGENN